MEMVYERSYHQVDSEKKNSSPRNPEEHSRNTILRRLMKFHRSHISQFLQTSRIKVLEEPCKTVEELEELCDKLKDADFRKKIGGGSLGDGIRRMLKKIGDNSLWGRYSYKGRKGKLKFQQLIINDVIIRKFQHLPL
ncbi:hypothetical protein IRJ41_011959 [Triplophysa rosa]|uniref:Uncharacterized protein n=1 Tax=Triplophysa rosa TaxID=992332 RepID=A0A9W7X443_TRIRA|nr:hypothetical protein IRJ41_011959 [Triplophysa rosa]